MTPKAGLRCFVAMAVGRDDTDRLYDRLIRPTLTRTGIHPVFMGRLEHNDDIDKRIIREIEQADLVIADLTYARPSVYFEAGFAQREVPVIYTVRKDHFHPQPNDDPGNLRVHFDLQMRNIISWRNERDQQFVRKLTKRIEFVTRPLRQQKDNEARTKDEQHRFLSLPLEARLATVTDIFQRGLKHCGYKTIMANDNLEPWVGRKPHPATLDLCLLYVQTTFSARDIRTNWAQAFKVLRSRLEVPGDGEDQEWQWQHRWGNYQVPKQREIKGVRRLAIRLCFCSLNRVPRGRVEVALPSLHGDQTARLFKWSGSNPFIQRIYNIGQPRQFQALPISAIVYIFDGIRSERDAVNKAESIR